MGPWWIIFKSLHNEYQLLPPYHQIYSFVVRWRSYFPWQEGIPEQRPDWPDLHVKPTDKHQYLQMDSCHPQHCKTSIPYSQALRLRRICSEDEHLQKWTHKLKKHLLKWGYREQQLDKEIHRALTIMRDNCLQTHLNQEKSAQILLVVTYHPILPPFQVITKRHLPTLHTTERLQWAVPLPSLIAFRRLRNLRDLLVWVPLTVTS